MPSIVVTIFSLLCIFHSSNVIATGPSPSLFPETCKRSSSVDVDSCLQLLQSDINTASASKKEDLVVAMLALGASKTNDTRINYIEMKLKEGKLTPDAMNTFQLCNSSYERAARTMQLSTSVKDDKDYYTPTYDLALAYNDGMNPCLDALAATHITDDVLFNGNKVIDTIAKSAIGVLEFLDIQQNNHTPNEE